MLPMRNCILALFVCLALGCASAVKSPQASGQAKATAACLMNEGEAIELAKSLAGQLGWKVQRVFPGASYDHASGEWRVAINVAEGCYKVKYSVYVDDRSGQLRYARESSEW